MDSSNARLTKLAETANAEHAAAKKSNAETLRHMRKAGEALLEVKKIVGHGQFETWIRKNFHGSYPTAHNWMTLHKQYNKPAAKRYRKNTPSEQWTLSGILEAVRESGRESKPSPSATSTTFTDDSEPPASSTTGTLDERTNGTPVQEHYPQAIMSPDDVRDALCTQFDLNLGELSKKERDVALQGWLTAFWPMLRDAIKKKAQEKTQNAVTTRAA